jgi:chromosome segregation protein
MPGAARLLSELSKGRDARKEASDRLQEAENRQAVLDKAATDAIQALAESREGAAAPRSA